MKLLQKNDKKLLNQQTINTRKKIVNQQGAALIIFMLVLILSATTYFVGSLDSKSVALDRDKQTQAALAEAKAALIGDAVQTIDLDVFYKDPTTTGNNQPVTLSNPDLGNASVVNEGSETGNGGTHDYIVIGKLPWRSLKIPPLKDGWGECLWYVVSGRFKHSPYTSVLNWDTSGQIDVKDEKENQLATNLVALVIAPGPVLSGQDRSSGQIVYPQCGGNYDAKNYLDTANSSNAISGNVNYFSGTKNNSIAPNSNNKTFVIANNAYYNDQFAFITVDDIFNRVIQRSDFSKNVDTLLKSFIDTAVSATAGSSICLSSHFFCKNWIGMVFVKDYNSPSYASVTSDTAYYPSCKRVIIFGGKKDADGKYLNAQNDKSFNGSGNIYQGNSLFDPKNPTQDVIKCVPAP